jgi:hypothetical protein
MRENGPETDRLDDGKGVRVVGSPITQQVRVRA